MLKQKQLLDDAGIVNQEAALRQASGQAFYNTSESTLRRFNEENNEEAGEHFTPREVVRLMANLIFLPNQRPAGGNVRAEKSADQADL